MPRRKLARTRHQAKDHVIVTSRSYGAVRGLHIYFEGPRPKGLKPDGSINFGKHILEALKRRFKRFRWIITPDTDSITTERGIARVRTSQSLLNRMNKEEWDRRKDIKNDIVRRFFAVTFPSHFATPTTPIYVPGTLAGLLGKEMLPRLSAEDKDALNQFLPDFVASESVGTVNRLKAEAQIKTLKELATNLADELERDHAESWWQSYIKANILLMQQGYIKALGKINIAVGNTKFPDFSLVSHDNYLDILEIKRPQTPMLRWDPSRGNHFMDPELAKAVSQTENYIESVARYADPIRSYLLDNHGLAIKALRPRGIILIGDARKFSDQKQRDDFRLLSQGLKNISVVTYDELLTRLQNYISVLENFSRQTTSVARPTRSSRAPRS